MAQDTVVLEPGQTAPPIVHETALGERFELSEHLGQWVVVYFYPRANTPG